MGLIKAAIGAAGGVLADQWKEYFYCEAMSSDVLVTKGIKQQGPRSSNTKGSDNIISNGSGIAVADGQCMIIVEDGEIVEVCAEPGRFTYDRSSEPSIFVGPLGENIKNTFKQIGRRFTFGGDTGKDQRVYYFNTKEIIDNKFGTPTPIMFRVVDSRVNFDADVSIRCSGTYSYKIEDPLIFYKKVCGNISADYERSSIDGQLKAELIDALQPAMAALSDMELRPSQVPSHTKELKESLNTALADTWGEGRGLKVASLAISTISLTEEDQKMLKDLQRATAINNPTMAAGMMTGAMADSMGAAASNAGGAMNGFVGMGMAMGAGGMGAGGLSNMYAMGAQQQAQQPQTAPAPAPAAGAWVCAKCGKSMTGKFCTECGSPKPEATGWKCARCGAVNSGKFCTECGAPAPVAACPDCGWKPADGQPMPKFCPNCGKQL